MDRSKWGEYDFYAILEVTPKDSVETLRAQYKKMLLKYHPDKRKALDDTTAAHFAEQFRLVASGFRILSNPELRRTYNELRDKKRKRVVDLVLEKGDREEVQVEQKEDAEKVLASEKVEPMSQSDFAAALSKMRNEEVVVERDFRLHKFNHEVFHNVFNEKLEYEAKELNGENDMQVASWSSVFDPANNNIYGFTADDQTNQLAMDNLRGWEQDDASSGAAFAPLDSAFSLQRQESYIDDRTMEQRLHDYNRITSEIEQTIPQRRREEVIGQLNNLRPPPQ